MNKHCYLPSRNVGSYSKTTEVQTSDSPGKEGELTHLSESGKINFVNVSKKNISRRHAVAETTVLLSEDVFQLLRHNKLQKGEVESTVKLGGVMGAKQTPHLIPLCHNVPLDHVQVTLHYQPHSNSVRITCSVSCDGKTGVEMEALTGASIAALTLYDMCKSYGHQITISDTKLLLKTKSPNSLTDYMFDSVFSRLKNYFIFLNIYTSFYQLVLYEKIVTQYNQSLKLF